MALFIRTWSREPDPLAQTSLPDPQPPVPDPGQAWPRPGQAPGLWPEVFQGFQKGPWKDLEKKFLEKRFFSRDSRASRSTSSWPRIRGLLEPRESLETLSGPLKGALKGSREFPKTRKSNSRIRKLEIRVPRQTGRRPHLGPSYISLDPKKTQLGPRPHFSEVEVPLGSTMFLRRPSLGAAAYLPRPEPNAVGPKASFLPDPEILEIF